MWSRHSICPCTYRILVVPDGPWCAHKLPRAPFPMWTLRMGLGGLDSAVLTCSWKPPGAARWASAMRACGYAVTAAPGACQTRFLAQPIPSACSSGARPSVVLGTVAFEGHCPHHSSQPWKYLRDCKNTDGWRLSIGLECELGTRILKTPQLDLPYSQGGRPLPGSSWQILPCILSTLEKWKCAFLQRRGQPCAWAGCQGAQRGEP